MQGCCVSDKAKEGASVGSLTATEDWRRGRKAVLFGDAESQVR